MLPDFRVRQRDYLLEISRALTEELDLATVLTRILHGATELLAGQAGLVVLREEEGRWRIRAHYGIPEAFLDSFKPMLADIPEHGDARRFALPEINRRLRATTEAASLGLLHGVALPMVARNEIVGLIYIFRGYATAFTNNDRTLLASFANQAAIAVHNARLYQQTSAEKRRLDAILDSSADGILIMNAGHRIQRFNRALARLTGWNAAEALGRSHDEVIRWASRQAGPDLAEAEAGGWPLASNPTPLYVEGDLLRQGGGYLPAGITYAPLLEADGKLVNLIANVRDITKFREAEALKSTFISVISHELRTPVSLIKGYAETLAREDAKWDADVVRDSLAVIEEEADRLAGLIDNLLDASRLQAGAMRLDMSEVALDQLVARVVEKFKTQTHDHTLRVEFPPNFPIVSGDEARLIQVVQNLVSNALKYSPGGGEVLVRGTVEAERVVVSVTDHGPGIATPDLPHVFERFYRADSDLTRRVKGTGLGLYLAKAVVEAHGGKIWVTSEPGQGATFAFALPR
ncbi:MAG: PAS domain S-box protein [Anaerolineales bacterium]|nr:PAS domain S-box protein [Anaerolineales bacterium]